MKPDIDIATLDMGLEMICQDCQGEGIVQHPEWAVWFKNHPNDLPPIDHITMTEGIPEEVTCGECEGHGVIPTIKGGAILNMVRRWL